LTGVSAAGAVGTVDVTQTGDENGVLGVGNVGTVGPTIEIALTGVEASGAVGTVIFYVVYERALTGVSAEGAVDSVGGASDRSVALSGVSASGGLGTTGVLHENALNAEGGWGSGTWGEYGWGEGPVNTTFISGQVGTVTPGNTPALTGVEARGFVGTFGVIHINGLLGVFAQGQAGNVSVYFWTTIDDNQNPDWHNINNSEVADWLLIETEGA
jgi:hypothetical protein